MPPLRAQGRVIAGRYNLVEPIGRGAMGVVWRARDSLLDRDVAIKEVFLNSAIDDEDRENSYKRTMREARTAARLSHRGVVTIFDVAEEDGRPWIIMELVPSRSLEQVLASDGPLAPGRACRVGQQLLAALATAHAAGVLHRDVKPSNVLLADEPDGERAVLTDFGIAQFAGDPRMTQTGMVMGSPGFTAPERIRGGKATPASDLWSLGATLFAAVEGRGPYEERGGAITTMSAIINEAAPPASSAGPLAPLIGALLSRDPATRPTAAAAARMFARVLPLLPEASPPARRTPTLVSTAIPAQSAAGATPLASTPEGPSGDTAAAGTAEDARPAVSEDAAPAGITADTTPGKPTPGDAKPGDAALGEAAPGEAAAEVTAAHGPEDEPSPAGEHTGTRDDGAPARDRAGGAAGDEGAGNHSAGDRAADAEAAEEQADERAEERLPGDEAAPAGNPGAAPAFTPRVPVIGGAGVDTPIGALSWDWRGGPQTKPQPPFGPATRPRRGRWTVVAAVAVVLVAVIGAAVALLARHGPAATGSTRSTGSTTISGRGLPDPVKAVNSPLAALPAGWTRETVPPSEHGTAGGFSVGVPPGWAVHQKGLTTYLDAPDGVRYMQTDLTKHDRTDMLAEAEYVERNGITQGHLPGYHRVSLQRVTIRGTAGALWAFTWIAPGGVTMRVDDLLFEVPTAAGRQSYAIDFTSPAADFGNAGAPPVFDRILRTFEPVTG